MPCKECGKDDHSRSSSSKCLKRKRRVRETELESDQEISVYCIKKGLGSFVCPLSEKRQRLLETIRADVKELSRLSIELSYLINYFFKNYYNHNNFHQLFPKFDPLQFTYILKGKNHKLLDPLNIIEKYKILNKNVTYNGTLRSFNLMWIANQYKTILETNVTLHAFKRLKKYMYDKFSEKLTKSQIHESTFNALYKNIHSNNEIGNWFKVNKISEKELKQDFWKYIPLFVKIQHELYENDTKSFNVFPIYKHGLKHINYDSRCLHELLRRVDKENTPSSWVKFSENDPKQYWIRYFSIPKKSFGWSFSTDGVCVSLSMNRLISKDDKCKVKRVKREEASNENENQMHKKYKKIIAVDPGAKTPIATCVRNSNNTFEYKTLKKGKVVYETKKHCRERKRLKFIKDVDFKIRNDRESLEKELGFGVSSKKSNVEDYTKFQLKWFDEKQKVYEQRRLQRLRFDKYINDQKTNHKIVDEFFGKEPDTLVVYGDGFDFMNKGTFKGHRKFRHNDILKIIKQRTNLSLYIISEAFTTKNCSKCYEKQIQQKLHVSKSPHHYVYCSVCRKGIHRDKNGAKNILLKFEYKLKEKNKLSSILSFADTDMNVAGGGSS